MTRNSFVPALLALAAIATVAERRCVAQERRDAAGTTAQKADPRAEKAEGSIPPPDVVNAEKRPRQPPDPLDGPPYTTVKAWAIADGRTGEVLWGHREKEPLDMASTTKIMTAFIVVRLLAKDPKVGDEMVKFSKRADATIGSSAEVREGERLPVRELLYGLLLPSGNDAAVALAEHFGGRLKPPDDTPQQDDPLPRFVSEMNRVAAELGLRETHFDNPNGLPTPRHRSSARDLARLAGHALDDPAFAAVVSTRKRRCTLVDGQGKRRDSFCSLSTTTTNPNTCGFGCPLPTE